MGSVTELRKMADSFEYAAHSGRNLPAMEGEPTVTVGVSFLRAYAERARRAACVSECRADSMIELGSALRSAGVPVPGEPVEREETTK